MMAKAAVAVYEGAVDDQQQERLTVTAIFPEIPCLASRKPGSGIERETDGITAAMKPFR